MITTGKCNRYNAPSETCTETLLYKQVIYSGQAQKDNLRSAVYSCWKQLNE